MVRVIIKINNYAVNLDLSFSALLGNCEKVPEIIINNEPNKLLIGIYRYSEFWMSFFFLV